RRDDNEEHDQQLMDDRPAERHRGMERRADEDERRAHARSQRGRMDALVEGREPHQPDGPDQRDESAAQDQQRDAELHPFGRVAGIAHSITSPRIRNFASAAVATKLSAPMTSAASK